MQSGTIASGIGHATLILWVVVGDWLFPADLPPDIQVTTVSMITTKEFTALQAAAASTPMPEPVVKPVPKPEITPPDPVTPDPPPLPEPPPEPALEPSPTPEPKPEPKPEPPPEPDPVPEPDPAPEPPPEPAVAVAEEQPLPSVSTEVQPTPKAADVVAPNPVDVPQDATTAEDPTPAVSDQPSDAPPVDTPPTPEVKPEETGDVLKTEANAAQDQPLGMTASPRPKTRPARKPAAEPAAEQVAAADPAPANDTATEDAIAAALAAAAADVTSAEPAPQDLPQGPPLTGGEMGDISSAIGRKWNLGASSSDALSTSVTLRVSFAPDGKPINIELIESNGPSQDAVNNLFSTARRAVQRAHQDGGLPLPQGKYETWRVLDLVFDANGMRLR